MQGEHKAVWKQMHRLIPTCTGTFNCPAKYRKKLPQNLEQQNTTIGHFTNYLEKLRIYEMKKWTQPLTKAPQNQ